MSAQRSDAQLLAAHAAGDVDALGELVQRHQNRLWAVALRTLGDREEAADALQEAWISVLRNAGGFRGDSAVTTWLHRIVVNACLDRVRRRKARPSVALPEEPAQIVDPVDRLDERLMQLEIETALNSLPIEQRAAVVLVDIEGWSVEDAAAILDVAPGTIKSRCHRGRARLAVRLAHLRNLEAAHAVPPTGEPKAEQLRQEGQ